MNKAIGIFPFIIFSLLAAIWSGWIRIGWNFPASGLASQHGTLMVNGFLASLIFLERAVSFKNKWILLLPLLNALSILAFAFHLISAAEIIFVVGSIGYLLMCIYFIFRFKELYYLVFLIASFCLVTGNIILYKTSFYPSAVNWWIGFFLFTIVAERLELSRFLSLNNLKRLLLWICLGVVLFALAWPFHFYGNIFLSIGIGMTALWLLKYDMARHSVKVKGQHRYSGLLLIAGYGWLLIMSLLMIVQDKLVFGYDAILHSFFIGFVFSMIFSHAVIILPAITKIPVKLYRPILYAWFILLQASLVVRILADIIGDVLCRKIGGMANGVSILLFFISVAMIMKNELLKRKQARTAIASNQKLIPA